MRTILALTLYYIGDLIANVFLRNDFTARFMYRPYNKIMTWSGEIDKDDKVWKYEKTK
jgi:hypothetical protein